MKRSAKIVMCLALLALSAACPALAAFPTDAVPATGGDIKITPIRHASLMLQYQGLVIQVDPWSMVADYAALPKADLVLVTHHHRDHLDPAAVAQTMKKDAAIVASPMCVQTLGKGQAMNNGDKITIKGITIEAVPAYNLVHKRDNGQPFHLKGEGNGYVLTLGGKRIYIAGDTENIPEMKALKNIDIAFLPINLPYTMDGPMVLDAVKGFKPKVLYPYHFHFAQSQLPQVIKLMKQVPEVELRVRNEK